MKTRYTRWTCLLMALCLLMGLVLGCSGSAAQSATEPEQTAESATTALSTEAVQSTATDEQTKDGTPVGNPPEGTPPEGMGQPPAGERPEGTPPGGMGQPPAGGPGGGPGGPGGSSAYIDYSGAVEITSADSQTDQTYATDTVDQSALLIATSEAVTIANPTVTKSGSSNGGDSCNFYGLNAAVLVKDGASVTITGGTIATGDVQPQVQLLRQGEV